MKGSYRKAGQKISKNPQNWVLHKFSFIVYIQKWLYNVYIEYSNSYFLVKRTTSHSRFRMSWCVLRYTYLHRVKSDSRKKDPRRDRKEAHSYQKKTSLSWD